MNCKALHIVPALFGSSGTVGGAERYALELARHMAQEIPTRLLTFGDEDRLETIGKLEVEVIGQPYYVRGQQHNPIAGVRLAKAVFRSQIVHCHQRTVVASSAAAAACRLTGRRVFVSDLGGGGWDISAYISTDRWFDGHLHISDYSRKISGHASKPWAHVIYGGVDTLKFSPCPSIEKDGTVVFVGRLLPHKGIDDLIRALPPNTKLQIIGRPYDERYARDLKELAKGKSVGFLENFDDKALVDAYRRALCVVLPSVYRTMYGDNTKVPELLGQTLLEGMACGIPAICTDVASMPEIVLDGDTGFVVPPNSPTALSNAIESLQRDPGRARLMGQRARARVMERFTWPDIVRRCLAIYGCKIAEPASDKVEASKEKRGLHV